jgi:hypothetical protein
VRYDWLVNVILTVHFGYLAFVVFGGFLSWRWPKVFYFHLAAAIWGVLIVFELVDCPLTWAENWARRRAGQQQVTGFIDHYITGVLYPPRYLHQAQALVALVVLVSWIGSFLLWRRRRARARAGDDTPPADPGSGGHAATV